MGNRYLHHDRVEVVNAYLGIDTLHPYVSVIDLRRVRSWLVRPGVLSLRASILTISRFSFSAGSSAMTTTKALS